MPFDLDHALRHLIASEGSDLHLKVPSPPLVRLHGELQAIPGTERLSPADTVAAVQEMLQDPNKLAEFEAENEVDFSYSMEGLARFRVNAFYQRGTVSVVVRAAPHSLTRPFGRDKVRRRRPHATKGPGRCRPPSLSSTRPSRRTPSRSRTRSC